MFILTSVHLKKVERFPQPSPVRTNKRKNRMCSIYGNLSESFGLKDFLQPIPLLDFGSRFHLLPGKNWRGFIRRVTLKKSRGVIYGGTEMDRHRLGTEQHENVFHVVEVDC